MSFVDYDGDVVKSKVDLGSKESVGNNEFWNKTEDEYNALIEKIKLGGGHGGHNGLRDMVSHLGGNDFLRLRIGIGHPGDRRQVADYVLHRPSMDEQIGIDQALDASLDVMGKMSSLEMERYDEAMEKAKMTIEMAPTFPDGFEVLVECLMVQEEKL